MAESDDDLSTLSIPAEESAPTPSPQGDLRPSFDASKSSKRKPEASSSTKAEDSPPRKPSSLLGKSRKQRYPLYPSIAQLLYENGLSTSEADEIPASGPKGRLLKGDVLGYLGRISSSYSSDQSVRIAKLGHLDLSSVKPTPAKAMGPPQSSQAQARKALAPEIEETEVAIPISLASVISVQERLQATLGVTLPLSTFIARATNLANDDLPHSAGTRPSAEELFNDVLGLCKVGTKAPRGRYLPQITALPTKPVVQRARPRRRPDIYDILTDKSSTTAFMEGFEIPPPGIMGGSKTGESMNIFSVAAKGDERRARVFLERVKSILQVDPGRLIL